MINNRQQQAGRRRGRGGNGSGGTGNTGGPRQGGQGRPDNGNRIDNRARGNANQLYEKYKNLAADAQRQGDRVNTEYYHQFADHYFRVLSDQRGRFEEQQPRRQQSDFDMDGDDDYGDEGEPIRAGEQGEAARQERNRDGNRDDRPRNERIREDRPREDRQQGDDRQRDARPRNESRQDGNRNDAPRYEGQRNEGQRNEGPRNDGQRNEAVRNDGQRYDAPRNDGERPRRWEREDRAPRQAEQAPEPRVEVEVAGQHRADPVASGENLQERAEAVLEADAPQPRRRGRPRRDAQPVQPDVQDAAQVDAAPMVESNGVDADRLPPSLGIAAANDADASGEAPKPRRRRIRTVTPDEVGAG
ncbi:DUF4167 domain-containing protein [Sphingomonas mollis]|uniref:DUF4167 domain-containing protein n=1 Tax=Sphingomonas mollis TaxID=2795726 RepID=A0ABS0XTK2_9SPHN|nr:DUF4167 domain-containing protein [Sphingomonas sp. BT553]MBJ6123090.1 DUF4167 domain-containing protein [Sphingomonas sp. BT553]